MEFGEWLFVNEYPVADALDQVAALCRPLLFCICSVISWLTFFDNLILFSSFSGHLTFYSIRTRIKMAIKVELYN